MTRPDLHDNHGPGAYKLSGADKAYRRVSRAFEYQKDPHQWSDQRTVRCLGYTAAGEVCDTGFSLLSPDHLDDEVERLRNFNGVLDGPACGACGVRVLEKPDEFILNGSNERTEGKKATPKAIRLVHKPCRGRKGARFTASLPHANQETTADNLRILGAILNSAGIKDIQRMISSASTGKTIGVSRIYNRIAWLEEVFLAYEREMLRRWRKKVERSGEIPEHRLSHDDMVLNVNWETATDRRTTQLNCAVTADARSGFVYRLDVGFDPRITPLDLFNATYLDDQGEPKDIRQEYPESKNPTAPKFSWQRPTGRLHEPQFFEACVNEIVAFEHRAKRRMPSRSKSQRKERDAVFARTAGMKKQIRTIAEDWFGFAIDNADQRRSFKGMATRDIYTKAAHLVLVKEMLRLGRICLTTEQEATLPPLVPHIFDQEIREDRFSWMVMSFNKKATKPEKLRKVKTYRDDRWQFHNSGMFDGIFAIETPAREITEAYIAKKMTVAQRPSGQAFQISNYKINAFPSLWVRSPTQASGEIDKVVGFPILPRAMRRSMKSLPDNPEDILREMREELAPWIYKATLQPVSTFMNSLRERLSSADRAGHGGARVGGSYVQGAIFNPKTLIQLLNIFRVHYNFFELRPYASPFDDIDAHVDALIDPKPRPKSRALRIPGTDAIVDIPARARRSPQRRTPAMRHGIDARKRRKNDEEVAPDIYRILYRPRLFAGTKFGARLDRPRQSQRR